MNEQYGLKTVGRAFAVMRVVGQAAAPITLSEVAAASGLSTTIAFRFLRTLEAEGYLRRDGQKRYTLAQGESGALGLEAGLVLLDRIAQAGAEGVSPRELAADTGQGEGQILRALQVMRAAAVVEYDPLSERWIIAAAMIRFLRPLMNDQVATRLIRPMMAELAAEYSETVSWFVPAGWDQVVADVIASPHPVRFVLEIGARYPAYAGSAGKAQLAAMPQGEVEAWLSTLKPIQQTDFVVDPARLARELCAIRARGYATSASERVSGAASAGAAVRGPAGRVLGVVSVMMPEYRSSPALLARIGADISTRAARLFGAQAIEENGVKP
ncbi:MAG: transcriptional regulator, IclR family [Rhodobacteraceae bacterium HLUCCA12]|nr:MAG: transcriptional regulator, IclR family [Rhodobacteraceae bacterium HLUCCA12]